MASWQDVARNARTHRDDTIEAVNPPIPPLPSNLSHNVIDVPRQILSQEEIKITETPVLTLVEHLTTRKLTATAVTSAFLRRASVAQKLVNCVFELLPDRALARAKELDEYIDKHNTPIGPLHGVPISIKARISMRGLKKGGGFVGDYEEISQDDANILKIFWKAGAVFYVRTTEPQALMMLETTSNVTGITTNPHNTATTCGGSSGGEAALQALYGSPLGLGGDVGGSVRSPAGNCGTYALRTTNNRVPTFGSSYYMSGCETIISSAGPMSPTLEGLNLFMRVVLDSEPWKFDLSLHQLPWRDTETYFVQNGRRHLNVGVLWDDKVVKPTAPIVRAMKQVVEKLQTLEGFAITDWEPYQHERGMRILEKLYAPDGGKAMIKACEKTGEPVHPLISYRMTNGPGVEELSIHDVWEWSRQRELYRYEYLQEWNSKAPEMDVILCPYHQSPAPLLETTRYWGYTSIWNLLDYPAAVFPVTRVDLQVDTDQNSNYTPRSDIDDWCQKNFDAVRQKDCPVSLQLVGKRMDDEKVVRALEVIKATIGLPFVDCLASSGST